MLSWSVFFLIIALVAALLGFSTFAVSRSQRIDRLVNSPARLLIQDGKLVQENLQREWMRQETLQSELRMQGEEHPREVKAATLEPEGQVSVIKMPHNESIKKKDLRLLR